MIEQARHFAGEPLGTLGRIHPGADCQANTHQIYAWAYELCLPTKPFYPLVSNEPHELHEPIHPGFI